MYFLEEHSYRLQQRVRTFLFFILSTWDDFMRVLKMTENTHHGLHLLLSSPVAPPVPALSSGS